MNLHIGDEVYWNDPDENLGSGVYTVLDIIVDNEDGESLKDNSIILIGNSLGSKAEVYFHELSLINNSCYLQKTKEEFDPYRSYKLDQITRVVNDVLKKPDNGDNIPKIVLSSDGSKTTTLNISVEQLISIMNIIENGK